MREAALGFSNFVDRVAKLQPSSLTSLIQREEINPLFVDGIALSSLIWNHLNGLDGREYCVDDYFMDSIESLFPFRSIVGGTSTRVAIFLNSLGVRSCLHANSLDINLAEMFKESCTRLVQPDALRERRHYILEYDKEDAFTIEGAIVHPKKSDRLIFVPYRENPVMPVEPAFFDGLGDQTAVLFMCSLNASKSMADVQLIRTNIIDRISVVKARIPAMKVIFEDCGHHELSLKLDIMAAVAPVVDIYSCNETELLDFNATCQLSSQGDELMCDLIERIHDAYKIPTIIVHTKEYVVVRGEIDDKFRKAVLFGIRSATYWFLHGANPSRADAEEMAMMPDSRVDRQAFQRDNYTLIATKVTPRSVGHTLGLGDCFVGGIISDMIGTAP